MQNTRLNFICAGLPGWGRVTTTFGFQFFASLYSCSKNDGFYCDGRNLIVGRLKIIQFFTPKLLPTSSVPYYNERGLRVEPFVLSQLHAEAQIAEKLGRKIATQFSRLLTKNNLHSCKLYFQNFFFSFKCNFAICIAHYEYNSKTTSTRTPCRPEVQDNHKTIPAKKCEVRKCRGGQGQKERKKRKEIKGKKKVGGHKHMNIAKKGGQVK